MSVVPATARKRRRASFAEWDRYIDPHAPNIVANQPKFNTSNSNVFAEEEEEDDDEEDYDENNHNQITSINDKNSSNSHLESSLVILDSDDENYEFNKSNNHLTLSDQLSAEIDLETDKDSIIIIRENNQQTSLNHISEESEFETQFDQALMQLQQVSNYPNQIIGAKRRRTNSLPQLPLSQISYRRVSETDKIGEIKPNLILPADYQNMSISSSSSSASSSTSSASASASSSKYHQAGGSTTASSHDTSKNYTFTNNNSSLSPFKYKPQREKVTDDDGYYIAEPGEYFANGRFKILSILGKGTFGKVIKALDLTNNETVAIKIIKAIPKYREASKIELRILSTLKKADPKNLNNCIHLREVFDYENHICIMTDLLDISLYEFSQRNKFKPFPGSHIQAITRQLIRSVAFLHDLRLIHTDLKPENILLTSSDFIKPKRSKYKILKNPLINVIDFGSAIFNDEHHSELVSTRHYRAPEIVLGIGWSFPCDLWSLGCILVELATGEALFSTHENLEHLAIMEKVLDEKIPQSMINKIKNLDNLNNYFKKTPGNNYKTGGNVLNFNLNYPNHKTEEKSAKHVSKCKKLDDLICSRLKLKFKINMHQSFEENWERNCSKFKNLNPEIFSFWFYFIDLIKSLLRFEPRNRISAISAMNHPWWNFGIIDEATCSLVEGQGQDV